MRCYFEDIFKKGWIVYSIFLAKVPFFVMLRIKGYVFAKIIEN